MERLRRTMMFVPGSNPGMIKEANIYGADAIMFDLEDAVAVTEKDSARLLVFHALKAIDYGTTELVVRINGLETPFGKDDIEAMVRAGIHVIRLPKTDSADDVTAVEALIEQAERACGRAIGSTKMMAAIESPLGIINAYQIATSSKRLIAIALGAEDYVTNLKTKRYANGMELLAARSQIIIAARAAGLYAIDTVYTEVDNEEGFRAEVSLIKQLGFDGKSVINPRQIGPVHEIYAPSTLDIQKAIAVKQAAKTAEKQGLGVIALDGKMIDKPIVDRADRVIQLAIANGLYKEASDHEE